LINYFAGGANPAAVPKFRPRCCCAGPESVNQDRFSLHFFHQRSQPIGPGRVFGLAHKNSNSFWGRPIMSAAPVGLENGNKPVNRVGFFGLRAT